MYRQSEKNLLSSNISSTCPHNMVNFGPLAAEIVSLVWDTPGNFNGFHVLAALLHGILVVGVSQSAALNRGRHLYSAGRPSRWALGDILVMVALCNRADHYIFMLWFVLSFFLMAALCNRGAIIFLPCSFFPSSFLLSSSFFSSPNLSDRRSDVCHTSTHGVALVRI